MAKISLTDFLDIVSKSGTPKTTKVAQVKNRASYNPATDFYKKVRDRLIEVHQEYKDPSYLSDTSYITDPKKVHHFEEIISGYLKWWGKKNIKWFSPPSNSFCYNTIEVGVKPEMGLVCNNQKYVIKLHLKTEEITKTRADIVLHLMETSLRKHCKDEIMAVLDVRSSKLITATAPTKNIGATVIAELAYIDALWAIV
jgi:hypothetical protein